MSAASEASESELSFRQLAALLPIVIFRADREGRITYVNEHWLPMTGHPATEALRDGWHAALHPDDRAEAIRGWREGVASGDAFEAEFRLRHRDGSVRWVVGRALPQRHDDGRCVGWLGCLTDITAQKTIEARLEEAQRIGHLGYWDWDLVTNDLVWSDEVHRIFGVSRADFGDKYASFFELVHPADQARLDEAVHAARDPRSPAYSLDFSVVRPDGEIRMVHADGAVTFSKDGVPLRMLGTVRDITRQQLLMSELDHRVKNNLAMVVSLARQCLSTASNLESFSAAFVERLMAMARAHEALAAGVWEGLDLRRAIDLIVLDPASGLRERVASHGPDLTLPGVLAMPFCMTMHELTSNALKYGCFSTSQGQLTLRWSVDDEQLRLVWEEHGGPAVEQEVQPGMGTRMMRSFVEHEMLGDVELDFRSEGVCCVLEIPLAVDGRVVA